MHWSETSVAFLERISRHGLHLVKSSSEVDGIRAVVFPVPFRSAAALELVPPRREHSLIKRHLLKLIVKQSISFKCSDIYLNHEDAQFFTKCLPEVDIKKESCGKMWNLQAVIVYPNRLPGGIVIRDVSFSEPVSQCCFRYISVKSDVVKRWSLWALPKILITPGWSLGSAVNPSMHCCLSLVLSQWGYKAPISQTGLFLQMTILWHIFNARKCRIIVREGA